MFLNRELQLKILKHYAQAYPGRTFEKWSEFGSDEQKVAANLFYLQEHGLVLIVGQLSSEQSLIYQGGKLTAKGMDFLEDDGGLSAILGTVTIKLHDDTIKSLLESKILGSDLPQPEKQRYLDQLRELPAETTKHLVLKLVDLGLEKGPKAIEMIGKLLSSTQALG